MFGDACSDFGTTPVGNVFTLNDQFYLGAPIVLNNDPANADTYYGGSRGGWVLTLDGDDYAETYDRYPETQGER